MTGPRTADFPAESEPPEPRPTRAQAFIDLCGGPAEEYEHVGQVRRTSKRPKPAPPAPADVT